MIKYGSANVTELKFTAFEAKVDVRDDQWIDVYLRLDVADRSAIPEDVSDLSALVICTKFGSVVQIVPLDEGCDCEYQFTNDEKEQIVRYIRQEAIADVVQ